MNLANSAFVALIVSTLFGFATTASAGSPGWYGQNTVNGNWEFVSAAEPPVADKNDPSAVFLVRSEDGTHFPDGCNPEALISFGHCGWHKQPPAIIAKHHLHVDAPAQVAKAPASESAPAQTPAALNHRCDYSSQHPGYVECTGSNYPRPAGYAHNDSRCTVQREDYAFCEYNEQPAQWSQQFVYVQEMPYGYRYSDFGYYANDSCNPYTYNNRFGTVYREYCYNGVRYVDSNTRPARGSFKCALGTLGLGAVGYAIACRH